LTKTAIHQITSRE